MAAFLGGNGAAPDAPAADLFSEPEPATDPQPTGALLADLADAFTRHAVLPDGAAVTLALWTLHTWAFGAADFSPRLALTSPTKRAGKSTLLELLAHVCRRALMTASVTAAVLFRIVEKSRPTLLVDGADTANLHENEELRGVLNSGYARSGRVLRCVGDDHEPTAFATFAPVALAAIGSLPGTIADRAIPIRMERKPQGARVARLDRAARAKLSTLAPRCARWAADVADGLNGRAPVVPEALNDRQRDVGEPLLAIAEHAGGDWPDRARRALVKLCGAAEADATDAGERLLAGVWAVYLENPGADFLSLARLVSDLLADELGGWGTAVRGKPITTAWLSTRVRRFRVEPRQSREGERLACARLRLSRHTLARALAGLPPRGRKVKLKRLHSFGGKRPEIRAIGLQTETIAASVSVVRVARIRPHARLDATARVGYGTSTEVS